MRDCTSENKRNVIRTFVKLLLSPRRQINALCVVVDLSDAPADPAELSDGPVTSSSGSW